MPGSGHEFEHNLLIQECFGELEERVKTLEDAPRNPPKRNKAPVFGPIDPVAYPRTEMNDEQIKKVIEELAEPSPAPDLDALIDKHITIYYENPHMNASALLRAFAAELGYKP